MVSHIGGNLYHKNIIDFMKNSGICNVIYDESNKEIIININNNEFKIISKEDKFNLVGPDKKTSCQFYLYKKESSLIFFPNFTENKELHTGGSLGNGVLIGMAAGFALNCAIVPIAQGVASEYVSIIILPQQVYAEIERLTEENKSLNNENSRLKVINIGLSDLNTRFNDANKRANENIIRLNIENSRLTEENIKINNKLIDLNRIV